MWESFFFHETEICLLFPTSALWDLCRDFKARPICSGSALSQTAHTGFLPWLPDLYPPFWTLLSPTQLPVYAFQFWAYRISHTTKEKPIGNVWGAGGCPALCWVMPGESQQDTEPQNPMGSQRRSPEDEAGPYLEGLPLISETRGAVGGEDRRCLGTLAPQRCPWEEGTFLFSLFSRAGRGFWERASNPSQPNYR